MTSVANELLDLMAELREDTGSCGSLGSAEALAVLWALELAGRLLESVSTDVLSAYRRPAIAENFADGRISADEARALCDAVDSLPPTAAQMYADRVEKTLVELAPTVQLKDFPKLCNRIIQHIDPDGALASLEPEPLKCNVTLAQQRNGDWRLRGLLSCPTGTTHALLYGRMKDADVPVTVRPHRACSADAEQAGVAGDAGKTAAAAGTGAMAGAGTEAEARAGTGAVRENPEGAGRRETSRESAPFVPPADEDEYSVSSAVGDHEMPKVPLEALWEKVLGQRPAGPDAEDGGTTVLGGGPTAGDGTAFRWQC